MVVRGFDSYASHETFHGKRSATKELGGLMIEVVMILLWFVLPVAACGAALVADNEWFTSLVHLYLFVNYSVLAVLAFVLVIV